MRMIVWVKKLDEFLKLSEKKLLMHAGKISAEEAREKAMKQFKKYRKIRNKSYISDFNKVTKKYLKNKK